jgi:hypothetical protein
MQTTTLYRPVGQCKWDLIIALDCEAFPPRLPEQLICYPVLNKEYATQIVHDWNTKDAQNGNVGYVARFDVPTDFPEAHEIKIVGASNHAEHWIPAVNVAIVGKIETSATFRKIGYRLICVEF